MADDDYQLSSEDGTWWIAGYQDSEGNYYNLQDESNAVRYRGDNVDIYWDRMEAFEDSFGAEIADELVDAHHAVVGWMDESGEVHYNTLVGGIDLDYFDMDYQVDEWEGMYG